MAHTTRFPNGITNIAATSDIGILGMPDPLRYITYFEDFTGHSDLINGSSAVSHTVTIVQAGAGSAAFAFAAGSGGLFTITNDAADDDSVSIQHKASSMTPSTSKDFIIKARFKISDATQSDLLIGLAASDTTPLDVGEGIYLLKSDGSTTGTFTLNGSSASTSVATTTLVSDTFVVIAMTYSAREGVVRAFVDGVKVGETTTLTNLSTSDLRPTIHFQNGEAVAKVMTIDYLLCAVER